LKKAIVSVTNDLFTDQRVNRSCLLLHELGYNVCLVGRRKRTSVHLPERVYKTFRFKLIFEKGFLFYATFNLRLFFFLLFKKADLLLSNDLDTLLPNYLVSKIKKIPLVYDTHEYFTGVPEIQERPVVKNVWLQIEKRIFPKLKHIFTVNGSISKLYLDEYGKEVKIVRNVPSGVQASTIKTRSELGLPLDKKIVLLQGAGINIDRGAEEAVLSMLPEYGLKDIVLYIIGDGDVVNVLKEMVLKNKLTTKVFFKDKMAADMLFHYTSHADIGLTLDKDTNINYRYSLPNKLFDYIHAQVPVLVTDLVEVKNIVESFNIGVVINKCEPQSIAMGISYMLEDKKMYEIWKKNLIIARQKLSWENEQKELKNVFKQYL